MPTRDKAVMTWCMQGRLGGSQGSKLRDLPLFFLFFSFWPMHSSPRAWQGQCWKGTGLYPVPAPEIGSGHAHSINKYPTNCCQGVSLLGRPAQQDGCWKGKDALSYFPSRLPKPHESANMLLRLPYNTGSISATGSETGHCPP